MLVWVDKKSLEKPRIILKIPPRGTFQFKANRYSQSGIPVQMNFLQQIRIVLVGTSHPGNIGAAARAMKTMGVRSLVLVSPEVYPSELATARAVGASDVLDSAQVVGNLNEAVADCHFVVGASARQRKIPWPAMSPAELAEKAGFWVRDGARIALVFGREKSGLTNEELHACHYHVAIPTDPDFSSLNLAMAVQVLTYALRSHFLQMNKALMAAELISAGLMMGAPDDAPRSPQDAGWDVPLASAQDMEHFFVHLEQTMQDVGFHNPERPRQLMARLRRLFLRAHPDVMEVSILRGVLSAAQACAQVSHSAQSEDY